METSSTGNNQQTLSVTETSLPQWENCCVVIVTDSEVLDVSFKVDPGESLTFLAMGFALGTGFRTHREIAEWT